MAGEYSRELSVKVFAGQCRLIEMGYRQTRTVKPIYPGAFPPPSADKDSEHGYPRTPRFKERLKNLAL